MTRISLTPTMEAVAVFFAGMRRMKISSGDLCGREWCNHERDQHVENPGSRSGYDCKLCQVDPGRNSRNDHAFEETVREMGDAPALLYFVGGCVRDLLLGHEPKDIDLATDATPVEIEYFAEQHGWKVTTVGRQFGTVRVRIPTSPKIWVEVTTFRGEHYNPDSRSPRVVWGKTIVDDLNRRDFTINAIAARPDGSLVDPHNGVEDLKQGIVCAVGNAKTRFREDPLRILRGIRFVARFDFHFEARTFDRVESMRWDLLRLSKERITDEIDKMFNLGSSSAVSRALGLMFITKAWQIICPPLQRQHGFDQQNPHHAWKLHDHSIGVAVGAIEAERAKHAAQGMTTCEHECVARSGWAGLLHDIAKPDVKTRHKSGTRYNYIGHELLGAEIVDGWARQYKWSTSRREFVVETIRHHLEDECWLRPFDQAAKVTPGSALPFTTKAEALAEKHGFGAVTEPRQSDHLYTALSKPALYHGAFDHTPRCTTGGCRE